MKRIHTIATGLALSLAPVMVNPGLAAADPHTWPAGHAQPIDYVIQRALAQQGMPYVYGGGNAFGPTNGIRPDNDNPPANAPAGITRTPGTNAIPNTTLTPTPGTTGTVAGEPANGTVGFDSSGLIQYAFAAAGIKMPRTSGQQCSVGRKVPPAQARRGDLICYGPGGSQSVALFLGNGQMIEGTDPAVVVTPARTSNMTPYLTRIIDS